MSNHFHITLPSNSSLEFYPQNTIVRFTVKLPETIQLDGDFEFGLAEIIYQWRIQGLYLGRANLKLAGDFHGERGSASLYGGLGALPPVGSRGKAPGQGVRGASPP
jgi:hypothetical protein